VQRDSAASLQAQRDELRAQLEAATARATAAEASAAALTTALDAARAEARAALDQAALAQASAAAERVVSADTASAGEPAQRAELATGIEALQGAIAAARDAAEASAREAEELRQQNATLQQSVQRLEVEADREAEQERVELLRGMQGELRRNGERVGELEGDLRAAEDQIHRLESELRTKGSRRDEAAARIRSGAAGAETPTDVTQPVEPGSALDSAFSEAGAAASADGMTRYFVLTDGDTEIVHPLGRRTTIGRGLDNDIRIDTKFISRHHAVVLAGPQQTVVEDLRSTNGVTVNGKRGNRSVLRDGDIVHVGRTRFRFVQRSRER
jgi:hypothetical protein